MQTPVEFAVVSESSGWLIRMTWMYNLPRRSTAKWFLGVMVGWHLRCVRIHSYSITAMIRCGVQSRRSSILVMANVAHLSPRIIAQDTSAPCPQRSRSLRTSGSGESNPQILVREKLPLPFFPFHPSTSPFAFLVPHHSSVFYPHFRLSPSLPLLTVRIWHSRVWGEVSTINP